jgi:hypothetical protein
MNDIVSEADTIVEDLDILKYYCKDEQRRAFAYERFTAYAPGTNQEWLAQETGVSPSTLARWERSRDNPELPGSKPASVKGLDFLRERGLLPLTTESPTLGMVSYLAGLNWHSGGIHTPSEGQPASCPQFYVGPSSLLTSVAKTLNIPVQYSEDHNRYTLPAQLTLLFSELGIPGNGGKASHAEPCPDIVDTLLNFEQLQRVALFLGSQALTQASKHAGSVIIAGIKKDTPELARMTGDAMYALYRQAFGVETGTPKIQEARGKHQEPPKHYATLRMSEEKYQSIVEHTHWLLRKEASAIQEYRH